MSFLRNLFLMVCLLTSLGASMAQISDGIVLQRQTVSSFGGSASTKNVFVSHTSGQSSAHTQWNNKHLMICQGFEQGTSTFTANRIPSIQLSVYPNPNNGTFFLKSDLAHGLVYSVQVFDVQGRVLFTRTCRGGTEQAFSLPAGLASGVYMLSMQTAAGIKNETRLIIL